MSAKRNGVNFGKTVPQQSRRRRTKSALEAQLERGTKPVKGSLTETLPLTEKDTKRINKEVGILKERLK